MTAEERLRRLEDRHHLDACPKCGHITGDTNCVTPEQIAQVDAELQAAIAELEDNVRGSK